MIFKGVLALASIAAAETECKPPIDLMLVLDHTFSSSDLVQSFHDNYESIFNSLGEKSVSHRVGLTGYRNRKARSSDRSKQSYCAMMIQPFTHDMREYRNKIIPHYYAQGDPGPHRNSYGGIIISLRDSFVNWRPISHSPGDWESDDFSALRLVILLTNSLPDTCTDDVKPYPDYPEDQEYLCDYNYPEEARVLKELKDHEAHLGIIHYAKDAQYLGFWKYFVSRNRGPLIGSLETCDPSGYDVSDKINDIVEETINNYCIGTTTTTTTSTTTTTTTHTTPSTSAPTGTTAADSPIVKECKSLIKGLEQHNDEGCQNLCHWYGGDGGEQCGTIPTTAPEVVACATRLNSWCTEI